MKTKKQTNRGYWLVEKHPNFSSGATIPCKVVKRGAAFLKVKILGDCPAEVTRISGGAIWIKKDEFLNENEIP